MDNSILSKIDEIRLEAAEEKPDAILLNEIKPKNGKIKDKRLLNIPGYNKYINDIESPLTRGVCIYINSAFKSSAVTVNDHNFKDVVTVSVTLARKKSLLLQCIYRSGSPGIALSNDPDMYKLITKTSKLNGYYQKVIAGDFNLNKINWSEPNNPILGTRNENSPEEKFLECYRDSFLCQHLTEPTRYRLPKENDTSRKRRPDEPKQDDLLFSTSELDITDIVYAPGFGGSDHVNIRCKLSTDIPKNPPKRTIYKYDKGDYQTMRQMLDLDWENLLENKTIDESLAVLEENYNYAVKSCIPTKKTSTNTRRKPLWMNEKALRKVKKKHSSWVRYLNTKQGCDYAEFIKHRNKATHAINKARREYEASIAKECRKNPKGVWNYMKSTNKVKSRIPNLKKSDGSLTTTDEEIAEELNKQYYSVFTKETLENMPTFIAKTLLTNPLTTITIIKEDIAKILKTLHPRKAAGLDAIHPAVLREIADVISIPLQIIYQRSLDHAILPKKWLQAGVIPIFKKGATTDPANYRPVSLTSVLCKVLERIIVTHILRHLNANHLHAAQQHGFLPKKSITTNLLEALNIWTEALMHNLPVDVIYLDYAKAFDTVPHQRLINQVETFGIQGNVLNWIRAFLTDRQQKVLVNGVESSWSPVESGIPQGSILGPVLFTLFVNDIPSFIHTHISMYADDTKIFCPIINDDDAMDLVEDLANLQEWARKMQMRFHPTKCKVMHLGSNNPRYNYYMQDSYTETTCQQHTLQATHVEKDLGIYIDAELKFTKHIEEKVNTANRLLGYLRRTFKFLNKETLSLLYKSLIRPHLEFGSCIWAPKQKYNIKLVENVQRRATKLIPELRDLPYNERLKELKLETLSYRRMRADLIETYRILTSQHIIDTNCHCSLCPEKSMLSASLSGSTRGNTRKLQVHDATKVRQHFFANRIIQYWNQLSESAVNSKNVDVLKNHIEKEFGNFKHDINFRY